MTDGLRKSHLRKAPQVGLSEVGLPDIYHGDDGGHGDCVGNLYDSDHEKKNTNTNMTCSITLLPRLRPELARF